MNGKILKIASNDLYGNATDRTVSVFAAFNHLKYILNEIKTKEIFNSTLNIYYSIGDFYDILIIYNC